MFDKRRISTIIDHTALAADLSEAGVEKLCTEAKRYGFRSVFVPPCRVAQAVKAVEGGGVLVGSVVGFPYGYEDTGIKSLQAGALTGKGVSDIDMVINIGWIKDGRWEMVMKDIKETALIARSQATGDITVKVIIETCLLTDHEKEKAAETVKSAGADYVKTSTGYAGEGATVENVALLRRSVGPDFGVKASGGIRSLEQALVLVEAGADLIGTSAGVALAEEAGGIGG